MLLDINKDRLQADWYLVPTVDRRGAEETKAVSFVCEKGSARLAPA